MIDHRELVEQRDALRVAIHGNRAIPFALYHYHRAVTGAHPAGLSFDQYLPHWLAAQGHRTDLYNPEEIAKLKAVFGDPVPINGKVLAHGYSYVWVPSPQESNGHGKN
jgi:hypothetical protein